jgi:tRNA 2-thiouridine synthesizing protein C
MGAGDFLFVLQHPPLHGSLARAGLDTLLAYGAFELAPTVLFSGAGVLQLAPDASPGTVGRRDLRRIIDSLPLYDIESVHADAAALSTFGLDRADLPDFVLSADDMQIRALQAAARHIVSF